MKKRIFLCRLVFLALSFLYFADVLNAQSSNQDSAIVIVADANACELNSLQFDLISNSVRKNKERIFVIARAGKGETDLTNARRLIYVKRYLQNVKGWKDFEVIYAQGERINDAGRFEFYVAEKLWLVTIAPKNKPPCMDCCESEIYRPQNPVPRRAKRKGKS